MENRKIYRLEKEVYNVPNPIEGVRGNKRYVTWGDDNLYPETLFNMTQISPTHNACVQMKTQFAKGQKVTFKSNNSFLFNVNKQGESIIDIYNKLVSDYIIYREFGLNIVWSKDGKNFGEIEHIDYSKIRKGKKDSYGKINEVYFCEDWSDIKSNKIYPVPMLDKNEALNSPSQVAIYSEYNTTQQYYSTPDYLSSIAQIYLEYEIGNFHISNVKNAFAPSLLMNIKDQIDDPIQRDEIVADLQRQYRGTDNAGEAIITFGPNGVDVTTIANNGNADIYNELTNFCEQKILTAHRISSPMLLGIKTEGQLGGRSEIMDATNLFLNNVIIPIQNVVINYLTWVLSLGGIDVSFDIKQVQPIKPELPENLLLQIYTIEEVKEYFKQAYGFNPTPINNNQNPQI